MKKTVFLKNGPSHNLPKIKYVISEPHGDLLQWNLSWALTFDFLVHQEGGEKRKYKKVAEEGRGLKVLKSKSSRVQDPKVQGQRVPRSKGPKVQGS